MTTALSPELTEGLTTWTALDGAPGTKIGAQIRTEVEHVDLATMQHGPEVTALYLAIDDADRNEREAGRPFRLDADAARALRDLLNIATARGYL